MRELVISLWDGTDAGKSGAWAGNSSVWLAQVESDPPLE